jgi:hypothetical protein
LSARPYHGAAGARMDFDEFPYVKAQKAAHGCKWQAPAALSCEACKKLSGGARAPMPDVINLLAFGPAMASEKYSASDTEVMTAHLIAASALFKAASEEKVIIFGQRCERWTQAFLDGAPRVKLVEPFGQRQIPAAEFAGEKLTLSPVNMDWLCLAEIAAKPELWAQPDDWQYADNVRYFKVGADLVSLSKWIGEVLRTKARYTATKRALIIRSADEIGPAALDGLQVKERNTLIEKKACALTGKNITFSPKTINTALRDR